jgi:hypothetical protein
MVGKYERERSLENLGRERENNIEIYLWKRGRGVVYCILLAQDSVQWRTPVDKSIFCVFDVIEHSLILSILYYNTN